MFFIAFQAQIVKEKFKHDSELMLYNMLSTLQRQQVSLTVLRFFQHFTQTNMTWEPDLTVS